MTTIDHHTAMTTPAARPALVARVVNSILAQVRIWKNRRAVYRLGEMTHAELADIGLTRADLHVATGLPLGVDPTVHLGSMAQARIRRMDDLARYRVY
ncbi:MAG: DUF1127 domain-containing protein [Rhizobiaceae bacterium]|nr:DUF1127 domain-containing protein [Rhizobiaceae bacterium]